MSFLKSKWVFMVFGIHFGFALSRSEATEYSLIHDMFTFRNLKLVYLMAMAMVVGAIGMVLLRMEGNKTLFGASITVYRKPLHWGNVVGGLIFGVGWALSGACPGTVLGQIGEGKVYALFTIAGLFAGTYVYALLVERWPKLNA